MAIEAESLPIYEIVEIAVLEEDAQRPPTRNWGRRPSAKIITFLRRDNKQSFPILWQPSGMHTNENWFTWPELLEIEDSDKIALRYALTYHQRTKCYNPPSIKTFKARPKGHPTRCMFCHDDMSGMSANCLRCGGAMHFACAQEQGGGCITPGCQNEKQRKKELA